MSIDHPEGSRPLPDRPNLRHLKDQAKDLLEAGGATSITDAQFKIARLYGFASWPKLKAHLESREEVGRLKQAIDRNDIERVKTMMTRNPALHRAPLGYGKDGPLTWVAECRVPREPPSPIRLEMARWMIENGSDVHQGGDGPLMRAALGERIPMMDLLVSYGADVNAEWHGFFPIIFSPCESVDPEALKWLLLRGATLLHVAAEFGNVEAARLLLDRGADINARATVDEAGIGGQTAIFHAVTQFGDRGLAMAQFLVKRGADLRLRVKLPGHYERPKEVVECTPLEYALRFHTDSHSDKTVAFLRERGPSNESITPE